MKNKKIEFVVTPEEVLNSEMIKIRGGISSEVISCDKTKNKCKRGKIKDLESDNTEFTVLC